MRCFLFFIVATAMFRIAPKTLSTKSGEEAKKEFLSKKHPVPKALGLRKIFTMSAGALCRGTTESAC